ncbi:uncharacterized protein LOC108112585 [Drosophila eugracilis]|uniref:uncharacterized protein LOC108112585 n=1 Tax=Drosophila eugracilis TaxID=29029 RepID=UPI0007E7C8FD|nr:uncharacterized protein LOC108112585 [Drosophila eugracilis]XP_017078115.1 uncharacterized protein LOC108112585 [Drosophila eugracilis]
MRPPMAMPSMPTSTGLQTTELHTVQQVHAHATPSVNPQDIIHQDRSPHNHNHAKLPALELLVENKISYSSYQQHAKDLKNQSHNQSRSKRSSLSSPSSSEDCVSAARASIFDDAAENFVINFPSESASSQHLLPLSETVPLLTHIEATVVDKQRSIRLNKNSASLIFTKKELTQGNHNHHNHHHHHHHQQHNHQQQRRQHHSSLYGVGRKPTKHLPPTRGQHQRRSLPLSYNNNLVTNASTGVGGGGRGGGGAKLVPLKQQQQQHQHHGAGHTALPTANVVVPGAASSARKQLSYSWYAPVYSALEEELEQDSRDSSPIHNLANTKQHQRSASQKASTGLHATPRHDHAHDSADAETVALLDTQTRSKIIISSANGDAGGAGAGDGGGSGNGGALVTNGGGDLESSLGLSGGGQLPRRRRFENFLKSLVGLKASSSRSGGGSGGGGGVVGGGGGGIPERERPASPEIRITRTPSEQDVVLRDPSGRQVANGQVRGSLSISGSSSSLNVVQQKLWHIMRREGSASSLHQEKSQSIVQYTGLRKCETVLALTRQSQSHGHVHGLSQSRSQGHSLAVHGSGIFSSGGVEQIRPLNRLRNSVSSMNGVGTCSRCSSLLSLAASGSRYSLANGFVPRPDSALNQPEAGGEEEQRRSQEPHINVNAQIRLSGGTTANSTSPSPPSNVTTATLHSSSANNLNPEEQQHQATSTAATTPTTDGPGGGELGPFGTNHAYPLTVSSLLSMASANQAAQACCVRDGIALKRREMLASADVTPSVGTPATPTTNFQPFTCKLCLIDVEDVGEAMSLQQCGCQFCIECMQTYVEFEISEGAYEISCPDAKCPAQGAISLPEIANLTTTNLLKKHHRYRLNREIELDKTRTWCPRAGCETICMVGGAAQPGQPGAICQMDESPSTSQSYSPQQEAAGSGSAGAATGNGAAVLSVSVHCPSCKDEFCGLCKKAYHPNVSCDEFGRRLVADGQDDIGIPFDNELIKLCPMCAVPIEKDEGCAQMMCKRCKHVFCWYCLASLDDDFLLRHYDKGPCKNKLGHSRASVVWHRAQVIGIFAGFGILLLVASPLLLLAAPCIICCKCRGCSGSKIDEVDAELEEEVTALQG